MFTSKLVIDDYFVDLLEEKAVESTAFVISMGGGKKSGG
jgi:hypothetical protein